MTDDSHFLLQLCLNELACVSNQFLNMFTHHALMWAQEMAGPRQGTEFQMNDVLKEMTSCGADRFEP